MTENTATLAPSAFAPLVEKALGLFNSVKAKRAEYDSINDVDSALPSIIEAATADDKVQNNKGEMVTLPYVLGQLEAARKVIAFFEPVVNQWARDKALENQNEDYDEQVERANYNDNLKDLKELVESIRNVMETMGEIDSDGEAVTDGAEFIVNVDADMPKRINKPGGGGGSTVSDSETAAIREWARQNGYDVGDKGRIRKEVKDAYHAAANEAKGEDTPTA